MSITLQPFLISDYCVLDSHMYLLVSCSVSLTVSASNALKHTQMDIAPLALFCYYFNQHLHPVHI